MKELELILKKLGLAPPGGYGDTILIWDKGEIVEVKTMNRQLSKYIN